MALDYEKIGSAYVTIGGVHVKASKIFETVNGLWELKYDTPLETLLVDFNYINNEDGTATITGWKGTTNGIASTSIIIPNDSRVIL